MEMFQEVFEFQIKKLLIYLPPDHISEETKKLFWSGLKRCPSPLEFSLKDRLHVELVQAAANIYAAMFDLPIVRDPLVVIEIARHIPLKSFVPNKSARVVAE